MADQQTAPLTDEERAELEALRAEKAAREQAERARRERAELEALRAEQRAAEAPAPEQPAAVPAARTRRTDDRPPVVDPDNLTFGQRMVMTPDTTDEDGIPAMPPAQKIIIAIGLLCALGGGVWIALTNAGIL
ncbi:hypothetical protein [Collinsella tanakaei]|uniref:hypothetical protein n=1 Tax=Collinsella tanakaei TaxID=626935 RepID=UPI001F3E9DE9|nr:hypothetical protein [Collinsella tanakaei]MCF2621969.1 hypothetical protein [Collinsella tanakaei]